MTRSIWRVPKKWATADFKLGHWGSKQASTLFGLGTFARLGLGVLPALENKFEAVAVGVEHVAGIVTRIVVEPSTWFAIVGRARRHRGGIGCIDLAPRLCDETDMRRPAISNA